MNSDIRIRYRIFLLDGLPEAGYYIHRDFDSAREAVVYAEKDVFHRDYRVVRETLTVETVVEARR